MKKVNFLFFFILLCACFQGNYEQVRIVDKDGKPAKIVKLIPKFNEEQLIKQREAFNNDKVSQRAEVNKFRQDYNNQGGGMPVNSNIDFDNNIIVQQNVNYPNDIFEDRITNYDYTQNNTNQQNSVIMNDNVVNNNNLIKNNNQIVDDVVIESGDIVDNSKNSSTTVVKENKKEKVNSTTPKKTNVSNKGFYIQIGVYSEKKNADVAYNKYKSISSGSIDTYQVKGKNNYRVILGPYNNKKTAEENLEKVIKTGHYDVYITEKK